MATVDELLIRIDATTEGLRRELKKAQDSVGAAAGKMQRDTASMDKTISKLQGSLSGVTKVLAAFGIALGVGAMAGFTRRALDAAGGLGELAQQLGVTTQSLQVYQYAATQAGLKSEELNTGLARLSRTIGDAVNGEKEAVDAFKAIGVSVTDAGGKVRSTDAVLRDVADRFQAMPDDAREAAVAVDLFGKSGQKLLPILEGGSKGLDDFAARARALGFVLSDEQIAAADKAADQWAEFEAVLGKVVQSVAVELAPAISDLFNRLNQPEVIEGIKSLFEAFATVLLGVVSAIGETIGWLKRLDETSTNMMRGAFGAVVGFLVAGPLGAAAGAGIAIGVGEAADGPASPEYWQSFADGLQAVGKAATAAAQPLRQFTESLSGGGADKALEKFRAVAESIADATADLEFEATLVGKSARETDYLTQRRKLLNAALATGIGFSDETLSLIEAQAAAYADAAETVRDLNQAQDDAKKAAEDAAKAAEDAAKDFQRQVEQVAGSIADDLTTALFEGGKNGFDDVLENVGEWVRRIGLEILKQQIILPITTQLVGAVPGLFGITGGGTGTIGGTNIFGAVTGLAQDTFDWIGRTLGFGASAGPAVAGAGGRIPGGGVAQGYGGPSSWLGDFNLGSALGSAALGYGIGSLVGGFSPFGRSGPGSSIGGALGGLAGSFLPFPGGDLIGGLLGSLVGSLFGPKPSNGPFGLGTARASGGRLAYTTTQNLKGGVGDMTPLVNETIGVANQLADIFGAEFTDKANIRIGYVNAENGTKGYVVSGAGRPGTNDAFNSWKNFGENKQAAELFAIKQAVLGGSFNGLTNGPGLQGLSAEEKTYITKSFGLRKSTDEVLKDAALIVDLFGEQAEAMSEAAAAIKQVTEQYDAQIERAKELGISEAELVRRRDEAIQNLKTGFVEGIQDQILAMTDPVAFAIKQLDKDFETIRANAEDFGVGLVDVERLYGLKRQQIFEQYAQTTVADLQRFLEQLTFGDLSGASPENVLAGSRAAFEAAAAQALAGDAAARGRIQDLGTSFLTASRGYNASGEAYYADLARVQEIVQALLGEVPGYASGTFFHRGGPAIVGERGPELLMNLPRGAQVLPNAFLNLLGGQAGAGNDNIRDQIKTQLQSVGIQRQMAGELAELRALVQSQTQALRRLLSLIPTDKAA